jgi:tail sheath protein
MTEMILPGTYIEVRPEGLIAPGQVTVSNLGVMGTAAKGPLNQAVLLGSYAEAQQQFYQYDPWIDGKSGELTLVRALELAFEFGATTVYAVRVAGAGAAKASIVLSSAGGPCVALTATSEGTWGNDLLVNVTDATDHAYVKNELHQGNEPAPITLKRNTVVKSARNRIVLVNRPLQILYGGGLPDDDPGAGHPGPGQVAVNRTNGQLSFGDLVGPADRISASYLVDKASAVKVTIRLGPTPANEQTYNVADGNNLVEQIADAPATWVDAAAQANAGQRPTKNASASDFSPFLGGTNDAAGANYETGLDALLNEEAHIMVAAGQDNSFGNKLDAHCQLASSDTIKHDRVAVVGSAVGATVDTICSHNLNSDRVIFVAPGVLATDAAANPPVDVTLPGAYTAAAVAGLLASFAPHISLTNKILSVDDLADQYTTAELTQLVQARVLAIEKRQGFRVVKGITTQDGPFRQITTRRIVDYTKFGVRSAATPYIGLLNNDRVRGALRATLNSFLKGMVDDEMLISYELNVTATRDEEIKGIVQVTMTLRPVFSIDFIKVTMFLS